MLAPPSTYIDYTIYPHNKEGTIKTSQYIGKTLSERYGVSSSEKTCGIICPQEIWK